MAFTRLINDYNLPAAPGGSILYSSGVQDDVINEIGLSVLSEMASPTATSRMLAETSSLLLAARLLHAHSETEFVQLLTTSRNGLDGRKLRRVLEYIEEHLAEEISVADLASVAYLSIFHFTRVCRHSGHAPTSLCQPTPIGEREGNDSETEFIAQRDCLRLSVLITIELHSRVPAGDRHDASGVPTKPTLGSLG